MRTPAAGRLRRILLAMLAGIALAFLVLATTSRGLETIRGGRLGGDLPAFYGAGRILAEGNAARLYDPDTQEAAQQDLLPGGHRGRLPFPYPPYVALAYVPLTWLGFKLAYFVHALFMAACAAGAAVLLARLLPGLQGEALPMLGAALVFYPLMRAVLGGQNTPLSLLCAAGAATGLVRGRAFTTGLWVGVWLFKPQLALPVAAAVFLRTGDRPRFLAGLAVFAVPFYLLGVWVGGWSWPIWWWRDGAVPFAVEDLIVDRWNGISFAEVAAEYHLTPLNWIPAAALLLASLWLAWRTRLHPVALLAVAAGTAVLIAPHALYYDGGLAALGLAAAAAFRPSWLPAIVALWLLAWTQPLRPSLPVPPMTVVLLAAMALALRAGMPGSGTPAPDPHRR